MRDKKTVEGHPATRGRRGLGSDPDFSEKGGREGPWEGPEFS